MAIHKVVYRGLSDIRKMSVRDLKEAGVGVDAPLVWDKTKHGPTPQVFIQDISDRMLEILKAEGTFTVTEVDEETMREVGGEPVVDGQPLDDTGQIVRDGSTGQTSAKGEPNADADPVPVPSGTPAKGSTGRGSSTRGDGTT